MLRISRTTQNLLGVFLLIIGLFKGVYECFAFVRLTRHISLHKKALILVESKNMSAALNQDIREQQKNNILELINQGADAEVIVVMQFNQGACTAVLCPQPCLNFWYFSFKRKVQEKKQLLLTFFHLNIGSINFISNSIQ